MLSGLLFEEKVEPALSDDLEWKYLEIVFALLRKGVSLQKARCLLNDASKTVFGAHEGFCILRGKNEKHVFSNQLPILIPVSKILQENLDTLQWTNISLWFSLDRMQGGNSPVQPMPDKE